MKFGCSFSVGTFNQILPEIDVGEIAKVENNSNDEEQKHNDTTKEDGKIVEEEKKDEGVVKMKVFKEYWIAVGCCLSPMLLVIFVLRQGIEFPVFERLCFSFLYMFFFVYSFCFFEFYDAKQLW